MDLDNYTKFLVDTHALVWYLEEKRLPKDIINIFNNVEVGTQKLFIPVVALFEIVHLIKKKKIRIDDLGEFLIRINSLIDRGADIEFASLTKDGFDKILEFHNELKELENRDLMIVCTALETGSVLITRDEKMHNLSMIRTVWR